MAKGRRKKSVGLGDTIEKVTQATGIDKVVKFIAGEDCGCDKRKEKLNAMFPYKNINCLQEDEHTYLSLYFERRTKTLKLSDQRQILKIFNRVFNQRNEPTSCSSCWANYITKLEKVWREYESV